MPAMTVATPYSEHHASSGCEKQDSGPRIAEMHIKEMISVTPVSYIYSYTEKVLNSLT